MIGLKDEPIELEENDWFEIGAYIDGLTKYVLHCETPMAISVDGSWGCGKTSIMKRVRKLCDESGDTKSIWFDTLLYSQFHQEDRLSLTFLEYILEEIDENTAKTSVPMDTVKNIVRNLAVDITTDKLGGTVGNMVKTATAGMVEAESYNKKMNTLNKTFSELFAEYEKKGQKVVIFIDNLDRLKPEIAVSMLELFKVFFDQKNCVMIVALDKEVVYRGIQAKFDGRLTNEQVETFFDKMIQLPFSIPASSYQLTDEMLKTILHFEDVKLIRNNKSFYFDVLYAFSQGNPRKIKRISNLFLLKKEILTSTGILDKVRLDDAKADVMLAAFCLTAMQVAEPALYAELVAKCDYHLLDSFCFGNALTDKEADNRQEIRQRLENTRFNMKLLAQDEACDEMLLLSRIFDKYFSDKPVCVHLFDDLFLFQNIIRCAKPEHFEQPNVPTIGDYLLDKIEDCFLGRYLVTVLSEAFYCEKDKSKNIALTCFGYAFYKKTLGQEERTKENCLFIIEVGADPFPTVTFKNDIEGLQLLRSNYNYDLNLLKDNYPEYSHINELTDQDYKFKIYSETMARDFLNTMVAEE